METADREQTRRPAPRKRGYGRQAALVTCVCCFPVSPLTRRCIPRRLTPRPPSKARGERGARLKSRGAWTVPHFVTCRSLPRRAREGSKERGTGTKVRGGVHRGGNQPRAGQTSLSSLLQRLEETRHHQISAESNGAASPGVPSFPRKRRRPRKNSGVPPLSTARCHQRVPVLAGTRAITLTPRAASMIILSIHDPAPGHRED